MALTKVTGPGQAANDGRSAAAARKDYVRALEEELAGYVKYGKDDRAKAVKAELARVKKIKDREAEPTETAAADQVADTASDEA